MTEKHAAEVLADECDRSAEDWLSEVETRRQAAEMLRTIPKLEAESDLWASRAASRTDNWHAAIAERDALRADLETEVRLNNEGQAREDALRAEVEALRADADRYLWLRDSGLIAASRMSNGICMPMYTMDEEDRKNLDAAIDAARKS